MFSYVTAGMFQWLTIVNLSISTVTANVNKSKLNPTLSNKGPNKGPQQSCAPYWCLCVAAAH